MVSFTCGMVSPYSFRVVISVSFCSGQILEDTSGFIAIPIVSFRSRHYPE